MGPRNLVLNGVQVSPRKAAILLRFRVGSNPGECTGGCNYNGVYVR